MRRANDFLLPGIHHRMPGSFSRSTCQVESAHAQLAETRDHVTGIRGGQLHGAFAETVEAFGQAAHGPAVVAVVPGAAAGDVPAEPFQGGFRLASAFARSRAGKFTRFRIPESL